MPTILGGMGPPRRPPPGQPGRAAGVLVLLYPDDAGATRVVLTERASRDGYHSGEVSFPGGKAGPGDADIVATAVPEAAEENAPDTAARRLRAARLPAGCWFPVSDF